MKIKFDFDHCECRHTSIGPLTIYEQDNHIIAISWTELPEHSNFTCPLIDQAFSQIESYFRGERQTFTFPFKIKNGTLFQHEVWKALQQIPYGKTISYSELAERIGRPRAVRAVGMANHNNPLPIIIPCHRVIGRNGTLTGYAGGLSVKEKLLKIESQHCHLLLDDRVCE